MHAGHLWKKYVFYLNDGAHAQFLLKLRYDQLKQKEFFKILFKAYLEDHPLMRELILDLNNKKISKAKKKKMLKDQQQKEQTVREFALDPEEIESIFDAIEKESTDL